MILDSQLNFKEHISYIRAKIVPQLKMLDKLKHILNCKTKVNLYKTLLCPLFDYCDIVYEGICLVEVNTLQKQYAEKDIELWLENTNSPYALTPGLRYFID